MENFSKTQFVSDNYNFIKSEFIIFLAALVAPITPMLFLIGLLIVADTMSGVYSAFNEGGFTSIKSRILRNGLLPKIIFYPIAILISQAMESQFQSLPIMKTTGFLIMSFEARSIGENYKQIFGKSLIASLKELLHKEKL